MLFHKLKRIGSRLLRSVPREKKSSRLSVSYTIVLSRGYCSARAHNVPKQQPYRQHNGTGDVVKPIAIYHGIYNTEYERLLIGAVASEQQRWHGVGGEIKICIAHHNDRRRDKRMQHNPRDILTIAKSEKAKYF